MESRWSLGRRAIRDDERPLTPKGEQRMRQIAGGLLKLDLKLDRIVTSPLPRRAKRPRSWPTCMGIRERLEISNVLQTGSIAAAIQRWLRERTEDRLMIVGHNPTLSDLVSLLVLGSTQPLICDLKKGGIAALTRPPGSMSTYEIAWIAPHDCFAASGTPSTVVRNNGRAAPGHVGKFIVPGSLRKVTIPRLSLLRWPSTSP